MMVNNEDGANNLFSRQRKISFYHINYSKNENYIITHVIS